MSEQKSAWMYQIKNKRPLLKSRSNVLYPLLCKNSKLNNKTKLLRYKSLLRTIFSYDLQIQGSAKASNIREI